MRCLYIGMPAAYTTQWDTCSTQWDACPYMYYEMLVNTFRCLPIQGELEDRECRKGVGSQIFVSLQFWFWKVTKLAYLNSLHVSLKWYCHEFVLKSRYMLNAKTKTDSIQILDWSTQLHLHSANITKSENDQTSSCYRHRVIDREIKKKRRKNGLLIQPAEEVHSIIFELNNLKTTLKFAYQFQFPRPRPMTLFLLWSTPTN